ncbi:DUF4232 domain-containing protein [Streptomyces sp. TS71-3]|uniref:DUF4232 domain-containing protein n=1 Tax=Streptomyces sp. TS71-3 TaxID=2733862 RepID=UPI001B035591|nr:DUF4232 domain-containing protein [Streptomyces sp. TS71-3]GHJ35674.1 hypothetical protein Sm713_12830 [Streptomyces sp. TS71-3]
MLTRTARRGLPALVLVAAGLALTACGPDDSSSSSSSSGDSSSASASTSGGSSDGSSGGSSGGSSATTTGSSNGSSSGGPSSSGGSSTGTRNTSQSGSVQACATNELEATAENFSAGAGHTTFQIVFRNAASAPCALTGYPGVSFVKADGYTQMGKAAAREGGSAKAVTLIPNAHAYADVSAVNGPGGYTDKQCDLTTVPSLRVFPPNQRKELIIHWNKQECVGSGIQNLRVGPVHGNK